MSEQPYVLCVDDEPLLLEGLSRTLRENFEVVTETKPLAALGLLEKSDRKFGAIISDMRMPVMDGAKFLSCAAEIAPDAARILLTGHAELASAIAAVNTGRIFRFLTKPCSPAELRAAVEAGLEQHRLRRVERDLLEQTLTGSVRLLSEVLTLVAPALFDRTQRLRRYVLHLAQHLGCADTWRFELAACLCMIGYVGLAEDALQRALSGSPLNEEESKAFAELPRTAYTILKRIPRFGEVAEVVLLQSEEPTDASHSADILLGARLLRVSRSVERLVAAGVSEEQATAQLSATAAAEDRELLRLLGQLRTAAHTGQVKELRVSQISATMQLEDDVKTKTGVVVVAAGKQLNELLVERLIRFSRAGLLIEPVRVRVPD
jgi:response regulator RpfG family c-di-GMP phosphodiesterase